MPSGERIGRRNSVRLVRASLMFLCFLPPAMAQVKTEGPTDEKAQKTFEKAQKYLHERHKDAALDEFKAALDHASLENLPKAKRWLGHVEAAFTHRQPLNPADGDSAELASLIRGNVVAQLLNLKAQPSVVRAVEAGRLTVYGWYYDILTGRIEQWDEEEKQFVPLAE